MPKFRRGSNALTKIDELNHSHFTYRQTCYHGFPSLASAVTYDEETQMLALGTRRGEFRIYGRPGVEFRAQIENEVCIKKIYSFGNLYQYITLQDDNSLLLWHLDSEDGPPNLRVAKQFMMESDGDKTITACCLSKLTGLFYIGTESGHVYTLDVRLFELREGDVINWDKATSLIQGASPNINPGGVCSLELCPSKHTKLLIGYKKGIISLWDVGGAFPERNYPATVQDCQQPLESLCWQNDGRKFVTAHFDSGIYFWDSRSSVPDEGPTRHYGENCDVITKISWLNTDSNPLIVFSGGLPQPDVDDHHTVTVIQGTEHIALDFTSPVIDYATVVDPTTRRGKALIVLCEQEIMAFDLEAPKCPEIQKPYLHSVHASPVTCVRVYESIPRELLQTLREIRDNSSESGSTAWPVTGGCVRTGAQASIDILVTGHEDGSIKLWDISTYSMHLLHEVKTALIFVTSEAGFSDEKMFSDFTWPPYRKVSSYDPFEDDTRLAVKFIELCPHSNRMCMGGMGGQVLTFALNPFPAEVRVKSVTAEIYIEDTVRTRGRTLRNTSSLECKSDFIGLPAGFQPSFCIQCLPAQPITSLAFRPSFGLVAAGNSKGFMVGNFYTKTIIIVHPTVLSDGVEIRNISKVQSMRRSLRGSLRRRSLNSISDDERRKIVHALNLEMGINSQQQGGEASGRLGNRRALSTDTGLAFDGASPLPIAPPVVGPDQMGNVSHLVFSETHIAAGGPHVGLFASTLGSSLIRYSIEVPKAEERFTVSNRALPAGKDYALVHAAPIVALFVLDHDGRPIPSPIEVENHIVPAPNAAGPHFAVIVTQEQIKVINLPSMRSKRKEKVYNLIHERISKAWIMRVKVPVAPVGAPRDWNDALAILTTIGHLLVYSLPDLKLAYHRENYISPTDQKAMHSITISENGEVFFLRSFSEVERRVLCSYNLSNHTLLMPSLHSDPNDAKTSVRKTVMPTPKPETKPPESSVPVVMSPTHSYSVRNRSVSPPSSTPVHAFKGGDSKKTTVTNGGTVPAEQPKGTEFTDSDLKAMENAKAFTEAYYARKNTNKATSSSSESESDTDSESDDDDETENAGTFGNPMAFEENTGEGKELDNIIASSLQQLENARAFYERMQQHGRKSSSNSS